MSLDESARKISEEATPVATTPEYDLDYPPTGPIANGGIGGIEAYYHVHRLSGGQVYGPIHTNEDAQLFAKTLSELVGDTWHVVETRVITTTVGVYGAV